MNPRLGRQTAISDGCGLNRSGGRRGQPESGMQGATVADRTSLGFLGFIFGGVTVAVMLMATTVVFNHLDGHFVLESAPTAVASTIR